MNLDALEAATIELLALQKLADAESVTLSRDPIARTEIESREQAAREAIRELFDSRVRCCPVGLLRSEALAAKLPHGQSQCHRGQCLSSLPSRSQRADQQNQALWYLELCAEQADCSPFCQMTAVTPKV